MDVACDACCLINFLAGEEIFSRTSGSVEALRVPAMRLFIPPEVARESLYLLQPDPNDPEGLVKMAIDLDAYVDAGVLEWCHIASEEENDLYVRLAIDLDDGEAACLAIAKSRAIAVATDDRRATRLASELEIPVINTAQYVRHWADSTGASRDQVSATIRRIQRFARFIPRPDAPDAAWWLEHAG